VCFDVVSKIISPHSCDLAAPASTDMLSAGGRNAGAGERSDAKFSFADMQKGIGDSAREWLFCPPCGWRRLACKAAPLFTTLLHTRTLVKLGSGDLGRDVNSLASVPSAPLRGGAVRCVASP